MSAHLQALETNKRSERLSKQSRGSRLSGATSSGGTGGSLWPIVQQPHQPGVRSWVRRLTYWVTITIGVSLIAAAVRGYYWTTLELATSFLFTLILLFLLLVLYRLFVRWSLIVI